MTKIIKRIKDYSYSEKLEKLRLTILLERRFRGNQNKTFKIIKEISNYDRQIFNSSLWTRKFTVLTEFKDEIF